MWAWSMLSSRVYGDGGGEECSFVRGSTGDLGADSRGRALGILW